MQITNDLWDSVLFKGSDNEENYDEDKLQSTENIQSVLSKWNV